MTRWMTVETRFQIKIQKFRRGGKQRNFPLKARGKKDPSSDITVVYKEKRESMHLNIFRKISVKKTSFCPNRENGRGPEFGYRWHWPLRPNWAADIGALRKPRSLTSIRNDGKREWRAEMRQCLSGFVHMSERLETWQRKISPRSLLTFWV